MLKELIKEADTVEKAIELAAEELKVSAESLIVEVLQQPQKKTLGLFGGAPARVKVTVKEESPAEGAVAFLKKVLANMGVENVDIAVQEDNNHCTLSLTGDDLGFIIGRRGETLDALQYLTSLVANRVENAYYRVSLDIGNYREKRETTLTALARRHAIQAAKTGRRTSLEHMNPYERRIIHTAVQQIEGATSWSMGSEPNRHVVIGPSDDNPIKAKAPRRDNHRRNDRGDRPERGERREKNNRNERGEYVIERPVREVRQFIPRSHPTGDAADFAPPERTQSEKENSATLYGRIDL